MSHLRVYDTAAPDGLAGGTPHLHTLCTEAYAVVSGTGHVQTLTVDGYREVPLEPGAFVWFTPGTIHRLVNDGGLEILVLMQNAGLPEAGDMVITFDPEVMGDSERYAAAATLPEGEQTTSGSGSVARLRRDAAVEAFLEMRRASETDGGAALHRFHERAVQIVQPHLDRFNDVWHEGPLRVTTETQAQLRSLAGGMADHLGAASVHRIAPPTGDRRMGCCGTLGTYIA